MRIGVSLPVREMANDLGAIKAFAQAAEELGLTHLRVPDQVIRPGSGHLHEPLTAIPALYPEVQAACDPQRISMIQIVGRACG